MNQVIIFCSQYFIYLSALFALLVIIYKGDVQYKIKNFVLVFGSSIIAWAFTHFLKNIIAHPRPDLIHALVVPDSLYSFPSGHATFMFALASGIYISDKRAGKIIFLMALISGISRVLAGVHYWYDIVGAFVVAIIIVGIVKAIVKSTF
jgi:undecaprenyl-diphosphatase